MATQYLIFIVMVIIWFLVSYFFARGSQQEDKGFCAGWFVGTITFWTAISIYCMAATLGGIINI